MWYGQALEAHVLSLCIASGEQDGEGAPKLGLVSKSRFNMLFFLWLPTFCLPQNRPIQHSAHFVKTAAKRNGLK